MTGTAAGGAAPYYTSPSGDVTLYRGEATAVLRALPAGSVHCVCTSPPYWNLRDYDTATWEGGDAACQHSIGNQVADSKAPGAIVSGVRPGVDASRCRKCGARRVDAQLGLEATVEEYVENLVAVFRDVRRVLHPSGTLWLNLGDSYNAYNGNAGQGGLVGLTQSVRRPKLPAGNGLTSRGAKAKDLLMLPARVAIALRDDGWWLRAMIPWLKRSAMPSSATDRPTTATEYVFLLAKRERYFYDTTAVAVPAAESSRERAYLGQRPVSARHRAMRDMGMHGESDSLRVYDRPTRYRRDADWWFDSLRAILAGATGLLADEDGAPLALPVNPESFPGAHFATFPQRLVEPMLLASTSARGCCPACLAPWTRETSKTTTFEGGSGKAGRSAEDANANGKWAGKQYGTSIKLGPVVSVETTGWRAGCACEAGDPIPCTVLDPFVGSGTVPLVARKHGRTSWGIDLSAAYLDMARERLGQLALPGWSGAAAGG